MEKPGKKNTVIRSTLSPAQFKANQDSLADFKYGENLLLKYKKNNPDKKLNTSHQVYTKEDKKSWAVNQRSIGEYSMFNTDKEYHSKHGNIPIYKKPREVIYDNKTNTPVKKTIVPTSTQTAVTSIPPVEIKKEEASIVTPKYNTVQKGKRLVKVELNPIVTPSNTAPAVIPLLRQGINTNKPQRTFKTLSPEESKRATAQNRYIKPPVAKKMLKKEDFRQSDAEVQAERKRKDNQEYNDRLDRLATAKKAENKNVIGNKDWRQNLADKTGAIGDKLRVSNKPNFFDDYINPAAMVGDMASDIGQAPKQAKDSNSVMPYVTSLATPIVTGALAGVGAKAGTSTLKGLARQGNELFNPLAGTKNLVKSIKSGRQLAGAAAKEDLVDLYRVQEKDAKTFAQLAAEGKIPKVFNNAKTIAKKTEEEKYFGQWFTKDKADLDWYAKDREFINPETINLKVPKSKLSQYQNYDKSLSRAPDREFVIPHTDQNIYKDKKTPKLRKGLRYE
jgi:hypothetical protein